nr:hypothetical protein [Tanacetum cinerariifolium]
DYCWSLLARRCGTLVSADNSDSVELWDSLHETLLQAHSYHKGDVSALAASPSNTRVFSAGIDGPSLCFKTLIKKILTRRTLYSLKEMDLESAQNNDVVKLLLLKQGGYEMWELTIEQYFQVQDYALWDVIENGNSFKPIPQTTANADGTSTSTIPEPVTTKEKAQKKNDVKARSMLLMALPNEHLLTFSQYKDAKTLFEAIQARFGAYLDTMSIDDLYNNFKIVEQEVKRTVTMSSSSGSQNMAFLSSPGSTNEVDTTNIQVSVVSTPVSTVSTHDNTTNLSDETVYAFLANQPNGSQLVHEDLEQIHEDVLAGGYEMWELTIEQYFQVQDYALWDVIENGNSFKPIPQTTANADGTSTSTIPEPVTTKEKAQKKNDVKARSMLLMALPNEHLLTFSQYKDAKTLFEAIQARFGAYLDTMSIDDLYNNFKIVEQEVKRTVTMSSSSGSQNMAFLSSPGSTNEVDTTNIQVSVVSTPVSTVSTHDNTTNLSDETVYAFLANQPNGSQLVHEDLEQIHEDVLAVIL